MLDAKGVRVPDSPADARADVAPRKVPGDTGFPVLETQFELVAVSVRVQHEGGVAMGGVADADDSVDAVVIRVQTGDRARRLHGYFHSFIPARGAIDHPAETEAP